MSRLKTYPDVTTYRKRSVLPKALQKNIHLLMDGICEGKDVDAVLESCVEEIRKLPTASVKQAAIDIRETGRLYRYNHPAQYSYVSPITVLKKHWQSLLDGLENKLHKQQVTSHFQKKSNLCYLYMFHGDGHLREFALSEWEDPIDSPFIFAAWVYRLNDWSEEVRRTAYRCALQLFPQMNPDVIAEATFFLISQIPLFQRWGNRERELVEETLNRPDVRVAVVKKLKMRKEGRITVIFRNLLKSHGYDDSLQEIASQAQLPHVRMIAYETLLLRRARWQDGFQYQWIDKIYNKRKRVPKYLERPISHQLDLEVILRQGAQDDAIVVRKSIATALIRLREELSSEMREVGELLAMDSAYSVRFRARYYLEKLDK